MMMEKGHRPAIAVIDSNTLAAIGLKTILQRIMPIMDVELYGSFNEFEASVPDRYFHFFVSVNIVLAHRIFFLEHSRKTIVITTSSESLTGFHSINVNVSEDILVKSLLMLEQHAHSRGRNLPMDVPAGNAGILTDREIEVLVLIVEGYISTRRLPTSCILV